MQLEDTMATRLSLAFEIYDPRLNAWRMGDPMSSPRGYAAAVNLDGSVYLIGGLQSNVQILDTVSNLVLIDI